MLTLTSPVETPFHRLPAGAKLGALCLFTALLFHLNSPLPLAALLAALDDHVAGGFAGDHLGGVLEGILTLGEQLD